MREIKFKAFNKELGKMIHPDEKGWFNSVIRSKKNGVIQTVGIDLLIRGDYPEVEVLQYTGLKDKNGVEIYEGDIVEIPTYKGRFRRSQIVFEKGTFHPGYLPDAMTEHFEMEVIGNIYENPELLEGAE